jgi:DNA-binding NtrC family response regulator
VNCAGVPEDELEAELFGAAEGAEPGAGGALEKAFRGTLYLAEIGALPTKLQDRLLQEMVEGGKAAGVRLLAGSSEALADKADKGRFHPSLYQRLSVFSFVLTPLRERPEDTLGIALTTLSAGRGKEVKGVSMTADTELVLEHYAWPGNGDEVEQAILHAQAQSGDGDIEPDALPPSIRQSVDLDAVKHKRKERLAEHKGKALKSFLRSKEKEYLSAVLTSVGDSKKEAARVLKIDPHGLDRHIASGDI